MAEQQIKFKNLYSPRSIDTGGAERMQALQRLAGQVGDVAFEIGKQKRTEQALADGLANVESALDEAEVLVESGYEVDALPEYDTSTIYGKEITRVQNAAYLAGLQNIGQKIINEEALSNDQNPEAFSNNTSDALKAITAQLSPEMRFDLDNYFTQLQNSKLTQIAKNKIDADNTQAVMSIADQEAELAATVSTQAFNQDLEGLAATFKQLESLNAPLIGNGIDPAVAKSNLMKLRVEALEQYQVGQVVRNILLNDELVDEAGKPISSEERVRRARELADAMEKKEALLFPDPLNPDTNISLDQDSKENVIKEIRSRIDLTERVEAAKVAKAELEDKRRKAGNYQSAIDLAMADRTDDGTEISTDTRIEQIRRMVMLDKLDSTPANKIISWLSSVEKLKAKTDGVLMGEFIQRAYDLNVLLSDEAETDTPNVDYLDGAAQLQLDMMDANANGQLSEPDLTSLKKTVGNLIRPSTAKATAGIFAENSLTGNSAWQDFSSKLEGINPIYRGDLTRSFYYKLQRLDQEEAQATDEKQREDIRRQKSEAAGQVIQQHQEAQQKRKNAVLNQLLNPSASINRLQQLNALKDAAIEAAKRGDTETAQRLKREYDQLILQQGT